ncbi:MAG TPA: hypothetical protein VED59_03030, partial [Acidimicrobiales bacterium]|nr:hypothetical protein [Acidimicrobiales bacterium]
MTIGRRVALTLLASAAILVVVVGFGASRTRGLSGELASVVENHYPGVLLLVEMNDAINSVSRGINGDFITEVSSNAPEWDAGENIVSAAFSRLEEARQKWTSLNHRAEELAEWQALQEPLDNWIKAAKSTFAANRTWHELLIAGNKDNADITAARAKAIEQWRANRAEYVQLAKPLGEAIRVARERVEKEKDSTVASGRSAVVFLLTAGLFGLAALVVTGLAIVRSIGKAIGALVGESERLTDAVNRGSLGTRAEASGVSPEFRPVLAALNGTMDAYS